VGLPRPGKNICNNTRLRFPDPGISHASRKRTAALLLDKVFIIIYFLRVSAFSSSIRGVVHRLMFDPAWRLPHLRGLEDLTYKRGERGEVGER
jgi:hypothetical protein